jgi:hypothetical protein
VLDLAGWDRAEPVLASLPAQFAAAERMEEANAWRNPVDLVALLERAFDKLPVGCQNSVRVPEKCGFAGGTRFLAPHMPKPWFSAESEF